MYDFIIPSRYLAPKWQAYVTPSSSAFTFANGVKAGSLWEIKQALLTVPEDVIMHHLSDDRHDLATWVEFVVGDKELAEELKKYRHRWGMIVTLERQMLRTLALPHYVAKRWLANSTSPFTFQDGKTVRSSTELNEALKNVSDETVAFHLERSPNDIAVWLADVIGDYELADLIEEATNRQQMQRFVEDHLEMLKEAAE